MDMSPADPSPANVTPQPDRVSEPRKIAARLIRATGLLLGSALTAIHLLIAWIAPPDMSHASPRSVFNFYLTGPLLLFFGPMFLAGWIAARVERRQSTTPPVS